MVLMGGARDREGDHSQTLSTSPEDSECSQARVSWELSVSHPHQYVCQKGELRDTDVISLARGPHAWGATMAIRPWIKDPAPTQIPDDLALESNPRR